MDSYLSYLADILILSLSLKTKTYAESYLCRRLHQEVEFAHTLFHQFGHVSKEIATSEHYLLDSVPVAVCDNIRIAHCGLVKGEHFRGRICSKRRYFYGVKVQVVATEEGVPVEFAFLHGGASDVRGLSVLPLALPKAASSLRTVVVPIDVGRMRQKNSMLCPLLCTANVIPSDGMPLGERVTSS